MSSIRSYSRRAGSLFAVAALVLATITPGLVPSFASADQLTERSIELSSSSADADNVTYNISFTSVQAAGSMIVDFCSDSPLIGSTCTAPVGFSATGVASSGGFTATSVDANTVRVVGTIAAATPDISVVLTGINNPTNDGPLYARILTYDGTQSTTYSDPVTDLGDDIRDQGSAAISITDTIGVSGAVLETLTFCVAGPTDNAGTLEATVIGDGCTNSADEGEPLPAPIIKLGEKNGDVVALDSGALSTGSIYSQLSTNAVSGAVVNLKSNANNCGGLLRAGTPSACDITPALDQGVAAGQARFGVLSTATGTGLGDLLPVVGSNYNDTTYALNYVANQLTGVTSTYGDPFLDTRGAPASNKNATITFGASVAPNTPAGLYSAELSLIATGKF